MRRDPGGAGSDRATKIGLIEKGAKGVFVTAGKKWSATGIGIPQEVENRAYIASTGPAMKAIRNVSPDVSHTVSLTVVLIFMLQSIESRFRPMLPNA